MKETFTFATSYKQKIVCLCGSTKFGDSFMDAALQEIGKGNVVLLPLLLENKLKTGLEEAMKESLKYSHFQKILMSDEILVIDVNGYIGSSTASEIVYAMKNNKTVRFLTEEKHNY